MALKTYRPTSPGRRDMTGADFTEITRGKPERSLVVGIKRGSGRSRGRITVRHQGGGHKRRYRIIDFKRDKIGVPGLVEAIEYDPNRSARIALVVYADGERRYILAPLGLKVNHTVASGPEAEMRVGNALPLSSIPVGTMIHNVEMQPGRGGQLVRAAGTAAQLLAKEGKWAHVRLPSGEVRLIHLNCVATIGQTGNMDHGNIKLGKAGRKRWLGKRPAVRGVVMAPGDHPHGGGEGRSPIGMPSPKSPWGKRTLGPRTRRRKASDKMIVRSRRRK